MTKKKDKRISELAKRIRRGTKGNPNGATAMIKDHARRHGVSVSTGYRDVDEAFVVTLITSSTARKEER